LSNASSDSASRPAPTTDDAFLGGALHLLQPAKGYRAGLDGVLLAAAVAAADGEHVLDVGAGVGVVGLAVARRLPRVRVTMAERDGQLAALARSNVARNGLAGRVHVIEADITRPLRDNAELAAAAEGFDQVAANPPYHVEGRGTAARDATEAAANAMPENALEHWMRFLAAMARPGGTVTLIYRADALQQVLAVMAGRFGATRVLPVYPREGEIASRVLVQATKGSKAALQLLPGLVLHEKGHGFRPNVEAILRHGAALDLNSMAPGA
jgi:tRNA1(Val) A37 N6-methylase TrmN6